MIYLNTNYESNLVNRYTASCQSYLRTKLDSIIDTADDEYKDDLNCFFSEKGISILIKGDVLCLELAYQEIFEKLPIVAERYNQKIFFSSFKFAFNTNDYNLKRNVDKEKIIQIKERVIIEIDRFTDSRSSIFLRSIREQLNQAENATVIRDTLNKLVNLKSGRAKLTEAQVADFPAWVNSIELAFNYDYLIKEFGREIVSSINISYCPYCAEEVIEPFKKYRPAIDHFYPKSKFPFLALSLYNFVPSGTRCNSDFKKNNEMLGYYHPHAEPFPEERLFEFTYPLDRKVLEEDVYVEINSVSAGADLSMKLFEIEGSYNKLICKAQFIQLIERYQYQESLGRECLDRVLGDTNMLKMFLNVNLTESPKKVQYQKFLVDALNQISGIGRRVNNT